MDGNSVTVIFILVCLYLCGSQRVAVATTDFENAKNDDILVDVKEYINKVLLERDRKYERKLEELTNALAYQRKRFENKINIMQATIDRNRQACSTEINGFKTVLKKFLRVNAMDKSEDSPNSKTEEQMHALSKTNSSENYKHGYNTIQKLNDVPFTSEHTEHRIRKAVPVETRVAFYAYVSSSLSNLGHLQDIVFDHVVTNIGNAYSGHHGTFVAPSAGTYVFTATLHSGRTPGLTYGHFVVNGVVDAKFYVYYGTLYHQASQTIVVDLQPGDDVSIQNTELGGGITGDGYSTFSGFLLYESLAAHHVI